MTEEKSCSTCAFADVPKISTVCQFCLAGGVASAPHWKAIGQPTGTGEPSGVFITLPPEQTEEYLRRLALFSTLSASISVIDEASPELQDRMIAMLGAFDSDPGNDEYVAAAKKFILDTFA